MGALFWIVAAWILISWGLGAAESIGEWRRQRRGREKGVDQDTAGRP